MPHGVLPPATPCPERAGGDGLCSPLRRSHLDREYDGRVDRAGVGHRERARRRRGGEAAAAEDAVLVERQRQQGRRCGRLAVRVEAPVVRVEAVRSVVGRLAAMRLVVTVRLAAMLRLVVTVRLAVTVYPNPLLAR